MKRIRFNHVIIIVLTALSVIFFLMQQLLYHDIKEFGFLFLQDMVFLPLQILLVTFILDRVLNARKKQERLEQIHIVISAFFTATGTSILEALKPCMDSPKAGELDMGPKWTDKTFDDTAKAVRSSVSRANFDMTVLAGLKEFLPQKKAGLLAMFSNPNLLEHDTFTDMLWALYHLTDELESRQDLFALPPADIVHIKTDMARAWSLLVSEWLGYMKHLKNRYPYLWSLAIRKNPFSDNTVIITEAPPQ